MFQIHTADIDITLIKLETHLSRAVGYCTYVPYIDGVVFDTGFPKAWRSILQALEGRPVRDIVNTHAHEDHAGNNAVLSRHFGIVPKAPAKSIPFIENPAKLNQEFYRKVLWGAPKGCPMQPLPDVIRTPKFEFQVFHTPGHSEDHVIFFESNRRWIVAGDAFLGVKVRVAREIDNSADQMEATRIMLDLKPRVMLCYHSGAIENATSVLEAKLNYMLDLKTKIHSLYGEGLSLDEITVRVLGPEDRRYSWFTTGSFTKKNLVASFLKGPQEGYRPDYL